MKIARLIFILLLTCEYSFADSTSTKPVVTQSIVYKTIKAGEMYLVWTMDGWKVPAKEFQLPGTYINNNMAYTKMNAAGDSFVVDLKLPKGIYIDFMFWASKDRQGKAADQWDNNWGTNYNFFVDGINTASFGDAKLYMADNGARDFNILEKGWVVFVSGLILLLATISWSIIKRKKLYFPGITMNGFLTGMIAAGILLMFIVRLQMNGHLGHKQYMLFGLTYSDVLFFSILSLVLFSLLFITKNSRIISRMLQGISLFLILASVIIGVLNIEIVKQLGKPVNINWLYYADFLKGTDAKNAIKNYFTPAFTINLSLIISGFILAAIAFAAGAALLRYSRKKFLVLCSSILLIILVAGYIQVRSNKFSLNKTENPVTALAMSWLRILKQPDLFTMKVEKWAVDSVIKMHEGINDTLLKPVAIQNIILFVMESTPAGLVQVYDSTYKVTPNINTWKKYAKIFTNMHSHFPGTVNAMFSMISGMYPMISYKTIIGEYPSFSEPSIIKQINKNGWTSGLFFSSEQAYNKLGEYIR
jgi:hypothetical protein